jgi:hypothetical protein
MVIPARPNKRQNGRLYFFPVEIKRRKKKANQAMQAISGTDPRYPWDNPITGGRVGVTMEQVTAATGPRKRNPRQKEPMIRSKRKKRFGSIMAQREGPK